MINSQWSKMYHVQTMGIYEQDTPQNQYYDLIQCYVSVCNQALLLNSDRFPFKQILGAAKEAEQDKPIEVNVIDSEIRESYIFMLNHLGISVKPHGDCADCGCVRTWNAQRSYLEEISRDPVSYIENPAKLNWEWMYDA